MHEREREPLTHVHAPRMRQAGGGHPHRPGLPSSRGLFGLDPMHRHARLHNAMTRMTDAAAVGGNRQVTNCATPEALLMAGMAPLRRYAVSPP